MNDNKKVHKGSVIKWAYRLKNGDFYRASTRGSWSLSSKEITRKEITVKNLQKATFYPSKMDDTPYLVNFMLGGKWIKVTITSIYEWE